MQNLADLRTDYTKASLDVDSIDANPIVQFSKWFDEALRGEVLEPNAMNLSTINVNDRPSSRIVLLKGIEREAFVFFTNYQSQKGKDLDYNPACALTFHWPELERQVRIEGVAERISQEESEQYFKSRPRGSQIGAWASPQSTVIKDRTILEERVAKLEARFEGEATLPKPNQWGGYAVAPFIIEFWQGRKSRLHDRIQFSKVEGKWRVNRLAP